MRQLGEFIAAGGEFQVIEAERLSNTQREDVISLMASAVRADYPERPIGQLIHYIQHMADEVSDINASAGNPFLKKEQTFYHRSFVAAILDGEMKGVQAIDDDVSSSIFEDELGKLERGTKHFLGAHVFGYRRWIWRRLGQRAVSPDLHYYDEPYHPNELTIVDAMGLFALEESKKTRQGLKSYPHEGERFWLETLMSWDLQPILEDSSHMLKTEPMWVFGRGTPEVPIAPVQQATTVGSVGASIKAIQEKKTDAGLIIPRARDRLTRAA